MDEFSNMEGFSIAKGRNKANTYFVYFIPHFMAYYKHYDHNLYNFVVKRKKCHF